MGDTAVLSYIKKKFNTVIGTIKMELSKDTEIGPKPTFQTFV
jgi:hypothetical protein